MFIGRHHQNEMIRKNIIIFGTLFNNIYITRPEDQAFKVAIEYGPREKFLAMTQAKPGDKKQAIILPRMSYELTGMQYDTSRKLSRNNMILSGNNKQIYRGIPWNYNFRLSITAKTNIDITNIVEQALSYFNPDYTVDVKFVDGFDHLDRVTIVYNSVSHEDNYSGDFTQRRYIAWDIDFTVKSWLYGPVENEKQIKFIDLRFHGSLEKDSLADRITIQPGLTGDGKPTTDPNETIPYDLINLGDDWDYIEQLTEAWEEE